MEPPEEQGPEKRGARRSGSAEASRQAEDERVGKMSVSERIAAALEMGQRYEDLRPVRRAKE
jgi:hypothetical protein